MTETLTLHSSADLTLENAEKLAFDGASLELGAAANATSPLVGAGFAKALLLSLWHNLEWADGRERD